MTTPKLTPEIKRIIQYRYVEDHMTTAALAREYRVSKTLIKNVVKGLNNGNEKFVRKLSDADLEFIARNSKKRLNKLTNHQLAMRFKVHPSAISQVLKKQKEFVQDWGLDFDSF